MAEPDYGSADLNLLIDLARKAGEIGMKYFRSENQIWYKDGNSPVSEADREIDVYLKTAFTTARPEHGWLSEETDDNSDRLHNDRLAVVDPIDGTRGFIDGDKRWCISIAIVENERPVHGVLYSPALGQLFAASKGSGVYTENISPPEKTPAGAKPLVTGSKKLIEVMRADTKEPFEVMDFVPSLAYRLALVAAKHLDGAFARPGASEWDVAAADIILQEADARFTDKSGGPVRYNQRNVKLPSLVAASKPQHENILGLANLAGILH